DGEATPHVNRAIANMVPGKVVLSLVWRHWKDGDRFIPLGMKNHEKLSDFLVDEEFSLPDKDQGTVIESAGRIVWVVGQRLPEEVKVTGSTARVLIIRMDR